MTDEAWKKFAKDGWKHDEVPSKRDCFEAGYSLGKKVINIKWCLDQGIELSKEEKFFLKENSWIKDEE